MADDGSKKIKNLELELEKKKALLALDGDLLTAKEKYNQLLEHGTSVLQSNNDTLKELLTNWEDIEAAHVESINAAEEELRTAQEALALEKEKTKEEISPLKAAALQRQIDLKKKGVDLAHEELAADRELKDEAPARIANNNKDLEQKEAQLRLINEATAATENMKSTVENAVGAVTGIGSAWKQTAMGSIFAAAEATSWGEALDEVGKTVADTLSPMNIAGSLMAGVAQQTMLMVWAMDNAQSEFRKATGAGDAYDDVISDIYEDNKLAGVSFGDAAQAVQGLMGSMAGFGKMGKAAKTEWAGMAATMSELSISVEDSGAFFTNATKIMGMNKEQTKALVGEMGGLANELGTSLGPLMSEFNDSMSDLAVYGDDAVGIFKRLKGASDVLGISVGSLVGSMKEMDTIEGAATRAGTLNAVLQGQFLDTHELLNASYEERILLTRKAIDASGKDWKSMGIAEKRMVANAAGFSDMAEAAKFMTTSVSDLESSMNGAGEASGAFKEIEDRAAKAQSITDKWTQGMESLAVAAGGLVIALSWLAGAFASLMNNKIGMVVGFLVASFAVLAGVFMTVYGIMTALASIQAAYTAFKAADTIWSYFQAQASTTVAVAKKVEKEVVEELTKAQEEQIEAQKKASKSGGGFLKFFRALVKIADKGWKGLLAMGAAFMMIGAGVAIAALGVAQLVLAFTGFSAGEILAISVALLVFGATMVGLAWVLATNAVAIAAAGAGLMWFGGAVFVLASATVVLALAFGLMVGHMIQLTPHMSTLAAGLMLLAPAIAWMALSLALIGPAGLLAFIGFVMVAAGLVILAVGIVYFALTASLALAAGLAIIAAGLVYFALTAGWAMLVLAVFVVAMLGLGVAMQMIGKNSSAFSGFLGQIDNLTTGSISKVNELAAAIESVGDALSNISMPGAIVLTMLLQEIGDVAEHAPKVTPAVSTNIEKLVGAAAEYSEIKWSFFGLAGLMTDPFVNMLKAAAGVGATGGAGAGGAGGAGGPGGSGGGGSGGGGGGTATTVVLELDGVVLGRTVEAVLNKRQRLRIAVD